MCNIKRMGPTILLGLAVILLLGAVSAQAGRAFACTTPNRLVNPAFDAPFGFAGWAPIAGWCMGGPVFTPPGAAFSCGGLGFPLGQGLAAPGVFAEHIDVEIENSSHDAAGPLPATWDYRVFHTDASVVTTPMVHPGVPGPAPPPFPAQDYRHFDAGFTPTKCIRGITITMTSGDPTPTCTDNYRVCGWTCRTIDIKPGSDPNCINPDSAGTVAVAILSTPGFDASAVVCGSLAFGPSGAPALRCGTEDVDLDGDLDLVAHFKVSATGITASTTEACLTGVDGTGDPFKACDAVCIPPGGAD